MRNIIVVLCCCLPVSKVYAGAVVAQQQQMKARAQQAQYEQVKEYMEQQQMQQMQMMQQQLMEQAIQQKIQQEVAAYIQVQQAQVQQQAVMQYVQQELAQRMVAAQTNQIQQQMLQQAIAAAVQKAAYQNAVQQRDYQVAQTYVQAQQQAVQGAYARAIVQRQQEQEVFGAVQQAVATKQAQEYQVAKEMQEQTAPYQKVSPNEVKDVTTLDQLWAKLDKSSLVWGLIIDNLAKEMTVKEYIERYYKQEGTKILKPPMFYVSMIDGMASQNPSMLQKPFKDILQIMAIIEYDFDNGVDKDLMAKKLLGEAGYLSNKQRLGK